MFRANVLFVLSLTGSTVRVLGQDDVVLTCPQEWALKKPVTLYCEVSRSSITTKCASAPQNTLFTQNGATSRCTVGPADYSSCSFGEPSSTSCGCRQNTTHYTFVYYIREVGEGDSGDWDCTKACNPSTGFQNPLTKKVNAFCTGVSVEVIPGPYDCTVAIVLTVVAQVVFVAAFVIAIVIVVKDIPEKDSWQRKAVLVGLMLAVGVTVICMAVAISMACTHKDDCDPLCEVAIILLVMDVIVVVIIVIIIVKWISKGVNRRI